MKYLKKEDILGGIAVRTGLYKTDATKAVNAIEDTITDALKHGDGVRLIGFGAFKNDHRKARRGRNPQTGKPITISARNVPVFKPGKTLKDAVNK